MRRNVSLLAVSQALANTTQGVLLSIVALVGNALAADKALSTLPHAVQWIGVMVAAVPVSMLMRRLGRRPAFMIGALFGTVAALFAAFAVARGSFWLFTAALFLFGWFSAVAQHYRFAAAEAADEHFRSRAISLVIGGGVVAAFVGPQIAKWTHLLLVPEYLATLLALGVVPLTLLLTLPWVAMPKPPAARRADSGRPMGDIVVQPAFIVAVLAAVIGWGAMVLMMASTPIAMEGHGHHFEDAAFVVQWHIFGMYAPGFFTGWLIARFGVINVLLAGLAMMALAAVNGLLGTAVTNFWIANICVGTGWNFLFVGATTLLTYTYTPAERAKAQGVNDFLVFGFVAFFSFASGWVQTSYGWAVVMYTMFPLIAAVLCAVLWLRLTPGAQPAAIRGRRAALAE
jgi:MFS family permease